MAMLALYGHAARAPLKTAHANKPHQAVRGKSNPAAVSGEAKPMIPRGGMTVRSRAAGERQSACRRSGDHTSGQEDASADVANAQRKTAASTDAWGPKKFLEPG